jgi:hypothetical protein
MRQGTTSVVPQTPQNKYQGFAPAELSRPKNITPATFPQSPDPLPFPSSPHTTHSPVPRRQIAGNYPLLSHNHLQGENRRFLAHERISL